MLITLQACETNNENKQSCFELASVTQAPWGGSTLKPLNSSRRSSTVG